MVQWEFLRSGGASTVKKSSPLNGGKLAGFGEGAKGGMDRTRTRSTGFGDGAKGGMDWARTRSTGFGDAAKGGMDRARTRLTGFGDFPKGVGAGQGFMDCQSCSERT